jgi:hypothetical protein
VAYKGRSESPVFGKFPLDLSLHLEPNVGVEPATLCHHPRWLSWYLLNSVIRLGFVRPVERRVSG